MSTDDVVIKTEEVIMETTEYTSGDEIDGDIQLLEDSGGESSYQVEFATQEIQSVTELEPDQYDQQQQEQDQDQDQLDQDEHDIMHDEDMHNQSTSIGGRQRGRQSYSSTRTGTAGGGGGGGGNGTGGGGGKAAVDEKRMRREIANCNERRRMQSINAGFQNLRSLLPRQEGEKLSKAAILQQTSAYIFELAQEKSRLQNQNTELKRKLVEQGGEIEQEILPTDIVPISSATPSKKRKLAEHILTGHTICDSSDEGRGTMSPEPTALIAAGAAGKHNAASAEMLDALQKRLKSAIHSTKKMNQDFVKLRQQYEKEHSLRLLIDEELQTIKRQLYSVATAPSMADDQNSYIHRDIIDNTSENIIHEDLDDMNTISYVEIDERTGQQNVVLCSSIEEVDTAADIISEDNVHEEIILSSGVMTDVDNEHINPIAKVYADGSSPNTAMLQPILHGSAKPMSKLGIERISEKHSKVKTEKLDSPGSGNGSYSGRPLESIVEAIRHLEGDGAFVEGSGIDHNGQQIITQHELLNEVMTSSTSAMRNNEESPLALTNKKQQPRSTIAELRPFLQIKGNKQVIITKSKDGMPVRSQTTIYKMPPSTVTITKGGNTHLSSATIASLKQQSRPGVIVAKHLPSSNSQAS